MQHSVSKVVLDNGAEGLFIDIPSANVMSVDIIFRAGDYLSPVGKTDTAHVMEHLVLGANKLYPDAKDFSKEFTKYGAYNNAYTGDYYMGYEAECEAGEAQRIIDLLCSGIESPLFKPEDFIAEVGNVREELKMRRNNDDTELSLQLEDAMGFVPKSYRQREHELTAVSLDDIKDHYQRTHTTSNMRFVLAGPLKRDLADIIRQRLESIALPKGDGYIDLPDELPIALGKPLLVKNDNLDNICYRLESVLPAFTREQRYSMGIFYDYLFNGLHSKVFGELREKGLVYGIFGNHYETKLNAVSTISGQVQTKNIEPVFDILHNEIKRVAANGLSVQTLEDIKKCTYGEAQRFNQTPGQLNNWYRYSFIARDEIVYFEKFTDYLADVTVDSVKNIAKQLLDCNLFGLGIMYNPADAPDAAKLQDILNRH